MRRHETSNAVRACALALLLTACSRTSTPPAAASAPLVDPRQDDRIAHLVGGCAKDEPFLSDTGDMIPILVSKLASGAVDPLHAARVELASIGDAALPELRRLFERCYGERFLAQRAQNVLEVLGMMEGDGGRDVILRGIQHPQETVRLAAVKALSRHARPEDYERVEALLPITSPEGQPDVALTMLACDRARMERQLATWLEAGGEPKLLRFLAPYLCDARDPLVLPRLLGALDKAALDTRVFLLAALARAGERSALEELRQILASGGAARRQLAMQALVKAGLESELIPSVRDDAEESLRALAAQSVGRLAPSVASRQALTDGLADGSLPVREACLAALIAHGDGAARDRALEFLRGGREEQELAMRVLREPMAREAALAERVLATLVGIHAGEIQPRLVDARALARAIGQVPLRAAAEFLMAEGARSSEVIQGFAAHRWYAQQAGNTGPSGRAFLRERWDVEPDAARRMDLVMGGAFDKSDDARAFLERVVDSERASPAEALYAADRLARLGPARRVAPLLKRVALRIQDPIIRPGFHCLLWTWYGRSSG